MIFAAAIEQAKHRQKELAETIERLKANRSRIAPIVQRCSEGQQRFESKIAKGTIAGRGCWAPVPYFDSGTRHWKIDENWFMPDGRYQIQQIHRARQAWAEIVKRFTRAQERLDRKIKALEGQKFKIDFWLLQKEETWGKVDPARLKEQIAEILRAAEELSQLLLGVKVPIAFDVADDAPLGYVPVHKEAGSPRKVYLGARILIEQPKDLFDCYCALIVHELGHILLHLKDSGKDYLRFRRLLRRKTTQAPHFFDIFNILLDEQLERLLRDTRPEWLRWFNRLDFHARRVSLFDWRGFLSRNGHADPDQSMADLAARRLIKVYSVADPPFATIQSAEIFSQGLGFTRLYAFYSVLRHRLPQATVREPWLLECLKLIPKQFKSLDVFEVHALAVGIYKIIMEGAPAPGFLKMKVTRSGITGSTEIDVPGSWEPDADVDPQMIWNLTSRRKRRRRSTAPSDPSSVPNASVPNPEGDPPPRPPRRYEPPPRNTDPRPTPAVPVLTSKRPRPKKNRGTGCKRILVKPAKTAMPWAVADRERAAAASEAERLKRTERSGNQSSKEKARLKKAAKDKARRESKADRPATAIPPLPKSLPSGPKHVPIANADVNQAPEKANSFSVRSAMKQMNAALQTLLDEVRAELAGKRPPLPSVDAIVPDAGLASDHKNTQDIREFPPPAHVARLAPDRRRSLPLIAGVRPLAPVLRPYLAVVETDKTMQEPLIGGHRLLTSGLKKHLAYGEMRLFADQRATEIDLHREALVGVLIDTSASMAQDGRLDRAKRLAALVAECLRDCSEVESVFLGFNQNVYLCGDHEAHSITDLAPAGKTNEAGALDYLRRNYLHQPCRRKLVIVLSDGLPTVCSVQSVCWLVRSMEKELGVRFVYGAFSAEQHSAYRRQVRLTGEINGSLIRDFGRAVSCTIR